MEAPVDTEDFQNNNNNKEQTTESAETQAAIEAAEGAANPSPADLEDSRPKLKRP